MYDKCYFCWDQLPKLKKESTASFFVNFGRNRGTKEPAYITVQVVGKLPIVKRYNIFMSLKTAREANRLFRGSVFATDPPECVFLGTPLKRFCNIFYGGTLARHIEVLTRPTAVHCGTLSVSNSHRAFMWAWYCKTLPSSLPEAEGILISGDIDEEQVSISLF